jgi:hypothetical protein
MKTSPAVATFRDPEVEARFKRDGFVVVDFASAELVAELLERYESLDSGISSGYYPSLMSSDEGYKTATHRAVTDRLWPLFDELISDYEPLLGVFMVKHPGLDTEVPPHQDWIVADESERPTMNVWMPLTEVDGEVGRMRVLPGSHRWLSGLRGSPSFPTTWEGTWERVRDELMVEVPIPVGCAMVYDIRLLHGTGPNRSASTRVVTSLYAIPRGATTMHYYRGPNGVVEGYRVPSNFCTTFMIGDVPAGEPFVEYAEYEIQQLSFDEIADCHRLERSQA